MLSLWYAPCVTVLAAVQCGGTPLARSLCPAVAVALLTYGLAVTMRRFRQDHKSAPGDAVPPQPTFLSDLQRQLLGIFAAVLTLAQEHQGAAAVTFIVGMSVGACVT